MSFRCAFLGCGPRARGHAAGFEHVTRAELVALCDMNEQRLNAFGEEHGVSARYTDLDRMLAAEKPDVVHLVTPPTLRVELMTRLSEAGVPGVIVEKPICLGADDYRALRNLNATTSTKFVVNHQLRHHPRILEYLDDVATGKLGQVRMIDASAVLPMSGQGVHVLDLMFAFNGYAQPQTVFGAASGYDDIGGAHPSPRTMEAMITFRNGVRALLQSGAGAPTFVEGHSWMHKRIGVYGTHGFRHWRMSGWERSLPDGSVESGEHDYTEQNDRAQGALTEALFDWIADDAKVSPTNLATSLDEWLVILAVYLSAVESRPVEMPFDPPDDLLAQYRQHVGAV